MSWYEANRIDYVFGLTRNARPVAEIETELAWAEDEALAAGRAARRSGTSADRRSTAGRTGAALSTRWNDWQGQSALRRHLAQN